MYNIVKIDKTKGKVATDVNLATLRGGSYLFYENQNITSWTADMPNLEKGWWMFYGCRSLKSFNSNINKLIKGTRMFQGTAGLTVFNSELSSLVEGDIMFSTSNLSKWNIALPNLKNAAMMFMANMPLTEFYADLPKVQTADSMFGMCKNLVKFRGLLPSLSSGNAMFQDCKLDARSILCIISSVPTWASGDHAITIGCGCSADDDSKDAYAQEIGYESFTTLNDAFIAKGWTVTWQFNGPAAANYSLRGPRSEQVKVFAKIAKADEDVASYTDGENFYNLDWGHVVNDDSYEEFESFEAALEHFNLTEINRTIGDE